MKIYILGSGSKGNSTLINVNDKNILIDVGFNYKSLKERLKNINYYPKDIDYILITHNHHDHISGLSSFLTKNSPVVYMSEKIGDDYKFYDKLKFYHDEMILDNILIKPFSTSHDAPDAKGILIEYEDESVVYVTDTGYIHKNHIRYLKNKNYYIIESNHDTEMLIKGKYPLFLQRRVSSLEGHLCNELCAGYLVELIGVNTKKVILAHLSEHNNTIDLALETNKRILKEKEIAFDNIDVAKQDEVVEVVV